MAIGSFGVLAVAAVAATPAWACSANAKIEMAAVSAPVGGVVTVNGMGFNGPATDGPVEIRWNSLTGTPIASSPAGASFSVQVPISITPGLQFIVAVQRANDTGAISWKSSVPLEVVEEARPNPPVQEPVVPGPVEEPVVSGPVEEPVVSGPVEEPVVTGPIDEPVVSGPVEEPVVSGPVVSGPVEQPVGSALAPVRTPGIPAPGAAAIARPGTPQRAAGGSLAARPLGPAAAIVRPTGGAVAGSGALARSPWPAVDGGAGLADGPVAPATAWAQPKSSAPAPSLFEPVDSPESTSTSGAPIGGGLVVLGLLATAGIGVAASQRKRVHASPHRTT